MNSLQDVFWRRPTHEAMQVVAARMVEREKWQELVRQRAQFQTNRLLWDRLTSAQHSAYASRFDALDEEIKKDRTLLYFPFDKQSAFHRGRYTPTSDAPMKKMNRTKTRMAICGNRAGKTLPGSVEALWWAQGTHPYIFTPPPPMTVWYVALDFNQSNAINKPILEHLVPKGTAWNAQARSWTLPNRSEIVLKSQQSGRGKFQGANVPLIVWDEEGVEVEESEAIWKECVPRTWDRSGQFVMTLTPIEGFAWIRNMARRGMSGDDPEVEVHQWSVFDNPYIPREELDTSRYDTDEERQVRFYGAMIPLGIRCIFNKDALNRMLSKTRDQAFQFARVEKTIDEKDVWHFARLVRSPDPTAIKVFEQPMPGEFYIAGVDTAGGIGQNYSVMLVLARNPLRVVCVYRSNILAIREFADTCAMIGQAYRMTSLGRGTLLVAESNNHGQGLLDELVRQRYDNLWYKPRDSGVGRVDAPGWYTDKSTRPVLESSVQEAIAEEAIELRDSAIVEECLGYRIDAHGRTGAPRGEHDDMVFALGIALAVHTMERLPVRLTPFVVGAPQLAEPKRMIHQARTSQWRREEHPW